MIAHESVHIRPGDEKSMVFEQTYYWLHVDELGLREKYFWEMSFSMKVFVGVRNPELRGVGGVMVFEGTRSSSSSQEKSKETEWEMAKRSRERHF